MTSGFFALILKIVCASSLLLAEASDTGSHMQQNLQYANATIAQAQVLSKSFFGNSTSIGRENQINHTSLMSNGAADRKSEEESWGVITNNEEAGTEQNSWLSNDTVLSGEHLIIEEIEAPVMFSDIGRAREAFDSSNIGEYHETSKGRLTQIEPRTSNQSTPCLRGEDLSGADVTADNSRDKITAKPQSEPVLTKRFKLPLHDPPQAWRRRTEMAADVPCRIARIITGQDCGAMDPVLSSIEMKSNGDPE